VSADESYGGGAIDQSVVGEYEDRYVAFLDLLGFTALVEAAEREPNERARLRESLRLMRDTLGEHPGLGLRHTYFSDCIVISARRIPEGLWEVFHSIEVLTFNLLSCDVLVRGGVAAGAAHHTKDFVYGTAVVRAHSLESNSAIHPLTLLAPEVLADAKSNGPNFLRWLARDSAERYFVHYLLRFAEYRRESALPGTIMLDDAAEMVMHNIAQRLHTDGGSVLCKARWLQSYWNRAVGSQGVFRAIEGGE